MNQHPEILLAVILVPSTFGLLTGVYLKRTLTRLLIQECGTEARADLWTRLTVVGMMLGPTALALMRAGAWGALTEPVEIARALLSVSLNGVLAVLGVLVLAVWRQIPARLSSSANQDRGQP